MNVRTDAAAGAPRRPNPRVVAGALYALAVVPLALAAAWPLHRTAYLAVTAGGAVAAAIAIAVVAWRRRWGGWTTAGALLAAFALLGLPLAVPSRLASPGDLLPGLGELAAGAVVGWKDLVTVDLPIGTYRNLLVPAFVVFLVGTCTLLLLSWRRDRVAYAAVPVAIAMVSFGLVFGSSEVSAPLTLGPVVLAAPVETALGAATLLSSLLWLAWRGHDERARALEHAAAASGVRLSRARSAADRRRAALGAGMIAAALAVAVAVVPAAAAALQRDVLRGAAGPDVELSAAVSPLAEYRSLFADDRADDVLFAVTSDGPLPQRVRLATLDAYDGAVFRSGGDGAIDAARYVRVPSVIDAGDGTAVSVEITIEGLDGIWMPTVGRVSSVAFAGPRAAALADRLYYNREAAAAVETAGGGLAAGDVVRIEAVVPDEPQLERVAAPGGVSGVEGPESLATWVDEHATGADGAALADLVALLRERGYLSHALSVGDEPAVWMQSLSGYSFQPSAAGHSLARIQAMFTRLLERENDPRAAASGVYVAAIGDDEQFAAAVALLARELGFPSRVVVGARLSADDPDLATCADGVCRAQDIAAWAEVQAADGSWITVDATPQHTQSPALALTEMRDPENVTEVRPDSVDEVVPPDPVQEDSALGDDDAAAGGIDLAWLREALRVAAAVLLLLLLVLGPFLVVLVAKAARRSGRRRAASAVARVAGAWEELLDAAADAGCDVPRRLTRVELAESVGVEGAAGLARDADRAVFSGEEMTDAAAGDYWTRVDAARRALAASLPFGRRLRMTVSLRSFARNLAPSSAAARLAERGKRRAARLARASA